MCTSICTSASFHSCQLPILASTCSCPYSGQHNCQLHRHTATGQQFKQVRKDTSQSESMGPLPNLDTTVKGTDSGRATVHKAVCCHFFLSLFLLLWILHLSTDKNVGVWSTIHYFHFQRHNLLQPPICQPHYVCCVFGGCHLSSLLLAHDCGCVFGFGTITVAWYVHMKHHHLHSWFKFIVLNYCILKCPTI